MALKTNKPILDPAKYLINYLDKGSEDPYEPTYTTEWADLSEYKACVKYFRPLLTHKKVCIEALGARTGRVAVLVQLDEKTGEANNLKTFEGYTYRKDCKAAAAL